MASHLATGRLAVVERGSQAFNALYIKGGMLRYALARDYIQGGAQLFRRGKHKRKGGICEAAGGG